MTNFPCSSKKIKEWQVFDKRVTFQCVYLFMLVNLIWRTAHQLTEVWVENAYDIMSTLHVMNW